jgi:endonuclease YncB( thermonuclease family)
MLDHRVWTWPGLAGALLLMAGVADEPAERASVPQRLVAESLAGPVSALVERVVDGDTIEVKARIWLGQSLTIRVRIDGVDAPELEARCSEERRMALAARDYLARRLLGAEVRLSRVVYVWRTRARVHGRRLGRYRAGAAGRGLSKTLRQRTPPAVVRDRLILISGWKRRPSYRRVWR